MWDKQLLEKSLSIILAIVNSSQFHLIMVYVWNLHVHFFCQHQWHCTKANYYIHSIGMVVLLDRSTARNTVDYIVAVWMQLLLVDLWPLCKHPHCKECNNNNNNNKCSSCCYNYYSFIFQTFQCYLEMWCLFVGWERFAQMKRGTMLQKILQDGVYFPKTWCCHSVLPMSLKSVTRFKLNE